MFSGQFYENRVLEKGLSGCDLELSHTATSETVACIITIEIVMCMCIMHFWKYHLQAAWLQKTSTCIISMEIVTHIFVAKTFTCINVAEISNCVIATETVTYIIVTEPQNLHNCNRCWHLCNCCRKCQLHSSNRNCHQQNWLHKLSLAEMVPVRDPFG